MRRYLLERGANPHAHRYDDKTESEINNLAEHLGALDFCRSLFTSGGVLKRRIKNMVVSLPKSLYFTTSDYPCHCSRQVIGTSMYGFWYLYRIYNIYINQTRSQTSCPCGLGESWRYSNGVLNGQFTHVIGRGGEGSVIEGMWCGIKSAYKFVPISNERFIENIDESRKELERRLNESVQCSEAQSDLVVPFFAHYRYVTFLD